jgi:hypothetical protein
VGGADLAWEGFISGCIKNPKVCALARNNTVESLTATLNQMWLDLKYNPPYIESLVIDYSLVKSLVFGQLYGPAKWANMSISLDALIHRDMAVLLASLASYTPIPSQAQAVYGIRCGDKDLRVTNLASLDGVWPKMFQSSKYFGDWAWGPYGMVCTRWPFAAKERYTGNFKDVKTRKPLLFAGSPFDPVTPYKSALNMSSGFLGAVAVQHNGYGVSVPSCNLDCLCG